MKLKIGDPTLRLEDERLLRGEGCFTDDIDPGDGLRVAFLRAPFAHARLTALDLEDARALAGVHLVASQTDLDADQVGAIGSTQAVISALCDALGVTHIDMPATPAAIWRALQAKQHRKAV